MVATWNRHARLAIFTWTHQTSLSHPNSDSRSLIGSPPVENRSMLNSECYPPNKEPESCSQDLVHATVHLTGNHSNTPSPLTYYLHRSARHSTPIWRQGLSCSTRDLQVHCQGYDRSSQQQMENRQGRSTDHDLEHDWTNVKIFRLAWNCGYIVIKSHMISIRLWLYRLNLRNWHGR